VSITSAAKIAATLDADGGRDAPPFTRGLAAFSARILVARSSARSTSDSVNQGRSFTARQRTGN
jgi:hypothetical protein